MMGFIAICIYLGMAKVTLALSVKTWHNIPWNLI